MQSTNEFKSKPIHTLASRRPRSTQALRDLAQSSSSSIPTSRLLVSALALAAARTWIDRSQKVDTGGGQGLLVLGYWGWKVWNDFRSKWRVKKTRRREPAGRSLTPEAVGIAFLLAVQSVAFFSSIGSCGPLRAVLLLIGSASWANAVLEEKVPVLPLIPITGGVILMLTNILSTSPSTIFFPFIYTLTSFLLVGPFSSVLRNRPQTKDKPVSTSSTAVILLSSLFSVIIVLTLWQLDFIPIPIPSITNPNAHLVGAGIIIGISRFVVLPHIAPGNKIVSRIHTSRDQVTLLTGVAAIQFFALPPVPTRLDALVLFPLALLSVLTTRTPTKSPNGDSSSWTFPSQTTSAANYWSAMSLLPPTWRPHLQTILRTPTSSKIFYFLLLNLAYMGVQMAYGIVTNSLGLISDAIHMLFDCLGLGVGLWASVAATWKPDGRYTYGYARVETLSGFANGLFLILISIFIIFEAIQRVIDPPEMKETKQLLLVSTIGLLINLWGMYATGGHHHHGHSHGHDHGHGDGHAHTHAAVSEKKVARSHSHEHHHNHTNGQHEHHDHSNSGHHSDHHTHDLDNDHHHVNHDSHAHSHHHHQHDHEHTHDQACNEPGHEHNHSHQHEHSQHHSLHDNTTHSHDHSHSQNHQQEHTHDHSHSSHNHDHDHGHGHDYGHSHDHAHSHNMRGVFLHVLADTLGSVGVIISTILIRFTGWTVFDPLASLFIAVLIMASVVPLVIDSGKVLCLDVGSATEAQIRAGLSELSMVNGLSNYSSPRFWPKCEGELSGSIHIQLAPSPSSIDPFRASSNPGGGGRKDDTIYANADRVVARVEKVLKGRIRGLTELVIQIEGSEEKTFCGCMTGGG